MRLNYSYCFMQLRGNECSWFTKRKKALLVPCYLLRILGSMEAVVLVLGLVLSLLVLWNLHRLQIVVLFSMPPLSG